jgi:hypothetical protein
MFHAGISELFLQNLKNISKENNLLAGKKIKIKLIILTK